MGNCNELAVINVSPLYIYVYDRRALMSHNTAKADDGLVSSASDGNRQRRAYWSDCGEQRRQWTSLSLSLSPKCSSRGYRIHGCTAGQSTHGCVSQKIKIRGTIPGVSRYHCSFSAHTRTQKSLSINRRKKTPKEKKPEMYIQENATVTRRHAQTQGWEC